MTHLDRHIWALIRPSGWLLRRKLIWGCTRSGEEVVDVVEVLEELGDGEDGERGPTVAI
jgi:hypothetical protein